MCWIIILGTKIIFWDLREPFIDNLYKHSVSQARLETITDSLDLVSRINLVYIYLSRLIFWDFPSKSPCEVYHLMYVHFQVLNQLCDVIVEPLRDRIVTGLLQASLVLILESFRILCFVAIYIYVNKFLCTCRKVYFV